MQSLGLELTAKLRGTTAKLSKPLTKPLLQSLQLISVSAVPPSIYTAIAYLELKELELGVLVNVIESVKYGVPYHAEFANLVGG